MFFNIYKNIFLSLLLCLGVQFLIAQPYSWNQLSLGFSPSPLDLRVGARGDIQIWRDGSTTGQLYDPFGSANGTCGSCWNMYNGIFMNVGSDTYVTWSWDLDGYTDEWVGGVSAITGSGTPSDPWRIEVDLENLTSSQYGFNMVYIYENGNNYIDIEMTPFVPNSNTDIIKVYHLMDTYLNSSDNGASYTNGVAPYDIVGVLASDGSIFEAFVVTDDPWDRYGSHFYYDLLNEPFNDGELTNTLDPDPTTDNAIGVQWTLGVVTGTQPTIKYRIGFTTNITDLIGCDRSYINKNIGKSVKSN